MPHFSRLSNYGIRRPIDLARALDIDRRYAWVLWWGKRQFTSTLALKLYDREGSPSTISCGHRQTRNLCLVDAHGSAPQRNQNGFL